MRSSFLARSLDAIASDKGAAGFSIGLVADGRLACAHAFGEKELGSGVQLTTKSVSRWASVSKPFVATAIMQLSERAQLDLDARLVDVLPEYRTSDPLACQGKPSPAVFINPISVSLRV